MYYSFLHILLMFFYETQRVLPHLMTKLIDSILPNNGAIQKWNHHV